MYSDEYSPDDAIFVSPIEDIEETSILGKEFIKATINLCHESEDSSIPLYFKKEYLPNAEKGMLVCGYLWMQGKISE